VSVDIRETDEFAEWFAKLRDVQARGRIVARLRRLSLGNPGDVKSVGQGVLEMRIDYGPGYRVYIAYRGAKRAIILCGGDKRSQPRDIAKAVKLAGEVE
jgi:putative addiction module killer protein